MNWDPVDKTVLANEQVSQTGHSWRSGAVVEKKMLEQWFFKITKFKKPLLDDLDLLRHSWPERVRTQQKNWIGKSEGAKIRFPVFIGGEGEMVEVFTTRADTLHGVQYLALSTTHSIVKRLARTNEALAGFIKEADGNRSFNKHQASDGRPKKGFLLPEVDAQNPIAPKAGSLPVFVAEYVIEGYGNGAVMGVPGHDNRDYAFWKENGGGQGIKSVIRPLTGCESPGAFTHPGVLKDNCGEFTSMTSKQAKRAIVEKLRNKGGWAESTTLWRLRDWLVSRQRYWGAPIPMVHCGSCGVVPVKEEDLPVLLPEGVNISGKGGSPLANVKEWVETSCPSCGGKARRDTDTMDTFVDSSWYFMRFIDPKNKKELFSPLVPFLLATNIPADPSRRRRPPNFSLSISTSAASNTRSCTSSMRGSSPNSHAGPASGLRVTGPPALSPSNGLSRKAWFTARPTRTPRPANSSNPKIYPPT